MPGAYASHNSGTVEDRVVVSNTLQGVYHVEVHNPSAIDPVHYTFRLEEGEASSSAGWGGGSTRRCGHSPPAQVIVVFAAEPRSQPHRTLGDLRMSRFFGMWRDRTDLPDSPALARMLREQAWKRS